MLTDTKSEEISFVVIGITFEVSIAVTALVLLKRLLADLENKGKKSLIESTPGMAFYLSSSTILLLYVVAESFCLIQIDNDFM